MDGRGSAAGTGVLPVLLPAYLQQQQHVQQHWLLSELHNPITNALCDSAEQQQQQCTLKGGCAVFRPTGALLPSASIMQAKQASHFSTRRNSVQQTSQQNTAKLLQQQSQYGR
jgi:hypothetical protein